MVVVSIICSLFGVFGFFHFPMWDGDSLLFSSAVISLKKGEGLKAIMVYPPIAEKIGEKATGHGFANLVVLSALSWKPSYFSLRMANAIVNSIVVVLLLFLLRKNFIGEQSCLEKAFVYLCLVSQAGLVFGSGRPEPFATFILAVALTFFSISSTKNLPWFGGVFAGILFCSHPLPGLLFFFLLLVFFSLDKLDFPFIKYIQFFLSWAASVGFLFAFILPGSLSEWIVAFEVGGKANSQFMRNGWDEFVAAYLISPQAVFVGPIVVLFVISVFSQHRKRNKQVNYLFFLCFFSALLFLGGKTFVFDFPRVYNLFPFFPLFLSSIGWLFKLNLDSSKKIHRYFAVGTIFLIVLFSCIPFFLSVVQFSFFRSHGISYGEAREMLGLLRQKWKGPIEVTSGFFSLTEDYQLFRVQTDKSRPFCNDALLIVQQTNIQHPVRGRPPDLPGFVLVKNRFSSFVPKVAGIKIANTPKAYNYAIYCPMNLLTRFQEVVKTIP